MLNFCEWLSLKEALVGNCTSCGAENVELWKPSKYCKTCQEKKVKTNNPEPNSRPLTIPSQSSIDPHRSPGQLHKIKQMQREN